MRTISHVIFCPLALHFLSTGTRRAGTARLVHPILSGRVSVPPLYKYLSLYVRVGPTLVPHHDCAPFHRSPPVKSKSDQPSPSINASDCQRQHHQVGPPASSLPLRPPPSSSLSASTTGPWRRTRKRRTATWPTHSNKVSSKRRRVMDGWAFNAPLPSSPRLRRMPVCCPPPTTSPATNRPRQPSIIVFGRFNLALAPPDQS